MTSIARDDALTAAVARWLVRAETGPIIDEAVAWIDAGERVLDLVARLRRSGLEPANAAAVTSAAHARRRMPLELAELGPLIMTEAALEQASSPAVASTRAERYAGRSRVADVTCGAGADLLALAATADGPVIGSDLDEARVVLAGANVRAAGVDAEVLVADALGLPVRPSLAHADPHRRDGGRRLKALADVRPGVPGLLTHLATLGVAGGSVALSPAVDLGDPGLPVAGELEFVQVGSALVEATLWWGELATTSATATIVDGGRVHRQRREGPGEELPVGDVGAYVVEVAPAAVRARLHDDLGARLGARRVARRRALLTTDDAPPASIWHRAWRVEAVLPARPKPVRAWLRSREARPIEIATAGADVDVDAFWRGIGRPPRGPGGLRLLLLRRDDDRLTLALSEVGGSRQAP